MFLPLSNVQLRIVKNLSTSEEMRFNEIKNFDVDPKNFTYHLRQLVKKKFFGYSEEKGIYFLTNKGKNYVSLVFESTFIDTFVGLYLIRRGKILVVKRKKVPYLGYVGIPTFTVDKNKFISETAEKSFAKLGLKEI